MAPLFPTASWLEHLGCRKHLLRFSLSRRWFRLSPLTLISRTGTLWRGEGRKKILLAFLLLQACYSYIFHSCFSLCFEASDSLYILYTNSAMLNTQFSAGSNLKYQHRTNRKKKKNKHKTEKFYFFQHIFFQEKMSSPRFPTLIYKIS